MTTAVQQSSRAVLRPTFSICGLELKITAPTRELIPVSTLNTDAHSSGVSSLLKMYDGTPATSVLIKKGMKLPVTGDRKKFMKRIDAISATIALWVPRYFTPPLMSPSATRTVRRSCGLLCS